MTMKIPMCITGLFFLFGCASKEIPDQNILLRDIKWIDLTHPFSANTLYWPNNPKGFTRDTLFEGMTDKGYYYSSFDFYAPEHGGTHLDAPVHFAKGKWAADEIPLEKLTGEAVVIDVSDKALKDADYLISINDIEEWAPARPRMSRGWVWRIFLKRVSASSSFID